MLFANLLIGPLILILAILFYLFPPKKINYLYGYRTRRSMKSQVAWDRANAYANRLLLIVASITCLVQVTVYLLVSSAAAVMYGSIVLVVLIIGIIPLTEKHLKEKVDE